MATEFFKMTGSGNDFVFVDGRVTPAADWSAERIAAACHRRFGVGADGFIILEPAEAGTVVMHYFNADGGRAALCGNGSLCATRLAARLGMAEAGGMVLRTDAGDLQTRCVGEGSMAELKFPAFPVPPPVTLDFAPGEAGQAWIGDIGVPHLTVLVRDLAAVDVDARGRQLRFDPRFTPAGTNVNFVGRIEGPDGVAWGIRTYERGVEGETWACGTGTICSSFAIASSGLAELPLQVQTSSGSLLSVAGRIEGVQCQEVWLCGEGRLVYSGTLL
ncbi:MAG: diaminopimelate epimerase [Gemmatimonadota bacterium]|nr:diaminopimelate epimerase [Gemmatimonadota bacterium]